MITANLQSDAAAVRLRAGIGLAGMFVVACFGAALFFSANQSQAAEQVASTESPALITQASDAQ